MSPHRVLIPTIPPGRVANALGWVAIFVAMIGQAALIWMLLQGQAENREAIRENREALGRLERAVGAREAEP